MTVPLLGLHERLTALEQQIAAAQVHNDLMPWKAVSVSASLTQFSSTFPGANSQALAASTSLQTLVNVTGAGFLVFACVSGSSNVVDTLRISLLVDGSTLCDVSATRPQAVACALSIFSPTYTAGSGAPIITLNTPIPFLSNLTIKAAKSVTSYPVTLYWRYVLADIT